MMTTSEMDALSLVTRAQELLAEQAKEQREAQQNACRAITEYEHGLYFQQLKNMADLLDIKAETDQDGHVRVWSPDNTSKWADWVFGSSDKALLFLLGYAVAIRGEYRLEP